MVVLVNKLHLARISWVDSNQFSCHFINVLWLTFKEKIDITRIVKYISRMMIIHNDPKPYPQHFSATKTEYPSTGKHNQFLPEFSSQLETLQTYNTTQVEEPHLI